MTAYNSIDGYPCAINPTLYGLLREWGFDGHVVSDCGAVYILFEKYGIARDYPEAESLAVKAGLNLRCGEGDPQLEEAFKRGIISQEQLDAGVAPLLRTWFRLGLFDAPERVAYSRIPLSENNSPAHAALALEAARRSIVLLKNDGVLPLNPKTIRRVALIGPNADSIPALLGNYHGTPTAPVTILAGLKKALGENVAIDYVRGCDYAELRSGRVVVPRTALTHGDFSTDDGNYTGLQGEYFDNLTLTGDPVYRKRAYQVDFHWSGSAPHAKVPPGKFSARWTGSLSLSTGDYELVLNARGGVRLFLNDKLMIDAWTPGVKEATARRHFTAGENVSVKIEYMSDPESAEIAFLCTAPAADTEFAAAVEKARGADAVIFVGGLYAQLEGEDMRVDFEGFASGDRTRIELPEIQTRLFRALAATGKPIVYVNLSGSAVAFPEIAASASAILQAWYPGQSGGTACAEILFGAVNPSGRLPVTFYRATADLPSFDDYRMENRTYRFFRGKTLYPFGHGLSYTRFEYTNLKTDPLANGGLSVSIDVANTGERAGAEVVQVYTHEPAELQRRRSIWRSRARNCGAGRGRSTLSKFPPATGALTSVLPRKT
jgi:beta-glucosidase